MKGLLHRLAARAAGTAVPVRSDARWRIGRPGFAGIDSAAALPDDARPAAVAAAALPARELAPAEPMLRPLVVMPAPVPARPRIDAPATHDPGATVVPPVADRDTAHEPRMARRSAAIPADGGPDAPAAPPLRTPNGLLPPVPLPLAGAPLKQSASPEGVGSPPHPAAVHGEPVRLLPEVAPAALGVSSAAAWAAPTPDRPATAAEATEVHVHIGRIDVTAVQETAPPRRRAASAPAPMSLDQYLARRARS